MSSRVARDAEVAALAAAGIPDPRDGAGEHIVALDALTLVVHPDNPVQSLSTEDIAAIFGGDVTNWSEVGGPDMPITVNALGDDSGTMDTFNLLVLRPSGYAVAPAVRRFEPPQALFAGPSGLEAIEAIVAGAPSHLVAGGWLSWEVALAGALTAVTPVAATPRRGRW